MQKIILATMVLMLLSSVVYGADWKYFGTDADGTDWFYDTQSILRGQDTTKVWAKSIFTDKTKASYIKEFPNQPVIENASYDSVRMEINCSKI
jgi:hypothetical protein